MYEHTSYVVGWVESEGNDLGSVRAGVDEINQLLS